MPFFLDGQAVPVNSFVGLFVTENCPSLGLAHCLEECWRAGVPFVPLSSRTAASVLERIPVQLVVVVTTADTETTALDKSMTRILLYQSDSPNFSTRTVLTVDAESGRRALVLRNGSEKFQFEPRMQRIQKQLFGPERAPWGYAIATSGTTSAGSTVVTVDREGAARHFSAVAREVLALTDRDTVLWSSAPTFDPGLMEFFGAQSQGARIVCRQPGSCVFELMRRERVTVAHFTPSFFRLALAKAAAAATASRRASQALPLFPSSLRLLSFGGEPLDLHELRCQWRVPAAVQIVNLYGITECSVWQTASVVADRTAARAALGRPLPGCHVKVAVANKDIDQEVLYDSSLSPPIQPLSRGFGQLWVKADRTCALLLPDGSFVERNNEWTPTGDLVEVVPVEEPTPPELYFSRRLNGSELKFNGRRLDLLSLHAIIRDRLGEDSVEFVAVVHSPSDHSLNAFLVVANRPCRGRSFHRCFAFDAQLPASADFPVQRVFHSASLAHPLTDHGKVDQKHLLAVVDASVEKEKSARNRLLDENEDLDADEQKTAHELIQDAWIASMGPGVEFFTGDSLSATRLAAQLSFLLPKLSFQSALRLLLLKCSVAALLSLAADNDDGSDHGDGVLGQSRDISENVHAEEVVVRKRKVMADSWPVLFGACVDSQPIVEDGCVFCGAHDGSFKSIDISSGRVNWSVSFQCPIAVAAPLLVRHVDRSLLTVATLDGHLHQLNAATGAILNSLAVGNSVVKSIRGLPQPDRLFVLLLNGTALTVGLTADGALQSPPILTSIKLPAPACSAVSAGSDSPRQLISLASGCVCVLDTAEQKIVWITPALSAFPLAGPVALYGPFFLLATLEHELFCLSLDTGTTAWRLPIDSRPELKRSMPLLSIVHHRSLFVQVADQFFKFDLTDPIPLLSWRSSTNNDTEHDRRHCPDNLLTRPIACESSSRVLFFLFDRIAVVDQTTGASTLIALPAATFTPNPILIDGCHVILGLRNNFLIKLKF